MSKKAKRFDVIATIAVASLPKDTMAAYQERKKDSEAYSKSNAKFQELIARDFAKSIPAGSAVKASVRGDLITLGEVDAPKSKGGNAVSLADAVAGYAKARSA
jgi:hypothetical protein